MSEKNSEAIPSVPAGKVKHEYHMTGRVWPFPYQEHGLGRELVFWPLSGATEEGDHAHCTCMYAHTLHTHTHRQAHTTEREESGLSPL